MLLDELLDAIALPKRETRFKVPPKGAYLIWLDECLRQGADDLNCITSHNVTFEVYAPMPDKEAEQSIEDVLDAYGISYFKYACQWLDTESLFLTAYDFSFMEKDDKQERGNHA